MAISKATILCARLAILAGAAAGMTPTTGALAGAAPVRWYSPVSDTWSNPLRWSTGIAPGAPGSARQDVAIDATGTAYFVDLSDERLVNTLLVGGPAARLRLNAGAVLDVAGVASSTRRLLLNGGTLRGGEWSALPEGVSLTGVGNRLHGITLSGTDPVVFSRGVISALPTASISGGLTIEGAPAVLERVRFVFDDNAGAVSLRGGLSMIDAELQFSDFKSASVIEAGSTVAGGGAISVTNGAALRNFGTIHATSSLNLSPGSEKLDNLGTIHADGAVLNILGGVIQNSGTLAATAGGTLQISSTLINTGVITASDATVSVISSSPETRLGNVEMTNSTLRLTLNAGIEPIDLDLSGNNSLALTNSTLVNPIIRGDGHLRLVGAPSLSGYFNNATFLGGDVTIAGAPGTGVGFRDSLSIGDGSLIVESGFAAFQGDVILDASSIKLTGTTATASLGVFSGSTLTLGKGSTLESIGVSSFIAPAGAGSDTRTFVNEGLISVASASNLTLSVSAVVNRGTIEVDTNGSLSMAGAWSNEGTIRLANDSELRLGGQFSSAQLGTIENNGARVRLDGQWEGGATPYRVADLASSILLNGGELRNGAFDLDGVMLEAATNRTLLLRQVTLANATIDLGLTNGIRFAQDLDLQGGSLLFTTSNNNQHYDNARMLNGEFVSQGGTLSRFVGSGALTVGQSATLSGFGSVSGGLVVESGGTVFASGGQFSLGTVDVRAGGAISSIGVDSPVHLGFGSVNAGALLASEGGRLTVATNFVNSGQVLLETSATGSFSGTNNTGSIAAKSAAQATFGSTLTNAGVLEAIGDGSISLGNLANTGHVLVSGGVFTHGGTFSNSGTIEVRDAGRITLHASGVTGSWQNTGQITVTNSEATLLGQWRTDIFHAISFDNASLRMGGEWRTTATEQFSFAGVTGSVFLGGTIIATEAPIDFGGREVIVAGGARLEGVVENATLRTTQDGAPISFADLSLRDMGWTIAANNVRLSQVRDTTSTLREGTITITSAGNNTLDLRQASFDAGTELGAVGLRVRSTGLITNEGTLRAIAPPAGQTSAGFRFVADGSYRTALLNNGSVIADGGRLSIGAESSTLESVRLLNWANGTLSGGDWIARNGGELDLGGRVLAINNATLRVEGASSRFEAMRTVALNFGVVEIVDHQYQSLAAGTFNGVGGTVRVRRGSATFGQFQNSGDLFLDEGSILGATTLVLTDTSRIVFGFSSYAESTLAITSNAVLDGVLEVAFSGGYAPAWGDTWRLLTAATISGDFDAVILPELTDDSLTWWSSRTETDYLLGVRHIADIDNDGAVGFSDLNTLLAEFGFTGSGLAGDLNTDGIVDFADLNTLLGAYGLSVTRAVPAPGVAVVLLSAAATLGRRRRERD